MYRVLVRRILTSFLAFFLVCVGTSAAVAQEIRPPDRISQLSEWEERQFAELKLYFDGVKFDYLAAREDPVLNQAFLSEFAVAYYAGLGEHGSQALLAQRDAMWNLTPDHVDLLTVSATAACVGRTGWRTFWPTVFLNSCQASALSNALALGAGVAGVAGMIASWTGAGPVVSGVIAGALVVHSSLYALCNSWGTGIQIFVNPTGIPICWAQ